MADEQEPLLKSDEATMRGLPKAPFAAAVTSKRNAGRLLPQAIAHRGYKAAYPENSMGAFRGAVAAGAHAVEADVHVSADGVAVLSHDASLRRCFGVDGRVGDCAWAYLSSLRTLREPREGLPRLRDLLAWMAGLGEGGDGREGVWVLLDVKLDDEAQALMDAIARAIAQVPPGRIPWEQRIMLGCWNATTMHAAQRTLPAFPRAHTGYSLSYARHFLPQRGLAFNMAHHALLAPLCGRRFMRALRDRRRALFVWTVNAERPMEWCLRQNLPPAGGGAARLVDGVVTDDPALFLAVCERFEDELDGLAERRRTTALEAARMAVSVLLRHVLFGLLFVYRRFVQRKLDYMDESMDLEKKEG
ncbi:Phosphatidylglycerol phospholipase C [Tolypocladium paradoxum]|uniref:Phosphatidylglycerol phospholipase C n=1 Tax=Tolypocladium paradoxum TaxID=94208 RepID=A0A2S4KR11_9HYPO|nr:Phosphatidylglycerol phospholipase C [Tolypocladium paradoxum]